MKFRSVLKVLSMAKTGR